MLARWLLAALVGLGFYGFLHQRLYALALWTPQGGERFLLYAAAYGVVAGGLIWLAPQRAGWLIGAGVLYALWWAGPLAVFAVLFFVGSCAAFGSVLIGAAIWMLVLWTALHFPVNFPWVYGVAFALPYLWRRPRVSWPAPKGRWEAAALALLLFVLGAQLLVALKPEISADGLGIHLALPMRVAAQGHWAFDHRHEVWALMPAGAEALYTGVYLLGGEAAAKLLNFAFLAVMAGLVFTAARRYTSTANAYLAAALFVSTPLVQLVTGSLFVENVWAALILGAALAVTEERFRVAAMLAGAAIATKLIAVAFVIPLAAIALLRTRSLAAPATIVVLFAAPPYAFAWLKSENPVFPFANQVFRSADYAVDHPFEDARYAGLRLSWDTAYAVTFRSQDYIEGDAGAAGFAFFVLLIPAALMLRTREQRELLAVAVVGSGIVFLAAPNLRYLYAAMPLASIAMVAAPWSAGLSAALLAVHLWFLPAAGYYDRDFALLRKSEIAPYVAAKAPVRVLIARLNREAAGQPVALFDTDAIAGLGAPAFTATWHNEHWWAKVRDTQDPAAMAALLRAQGIRQVIAGTRREAPFENVRVFLTRWLDSEVSVGALTLYRLRETAIPEPKDLRPLRDGMFDDFEPRIEFSGAWIRDRQFSEPSQGTLSYSDTSGDSARFTFTGSEVTYVYTRAANRGIAEIWMDGQRVRRVNAFARATEWQAKERIAVTPGTHTFELRVAGRGYVDLDAVQVGVLP